MKKYTTFILVGIILVLAAVLVGMLTFMRNQPPQERAFEPLVEIKAICPYCVASAIFSVAIFFLTVAGRDWEDLGQLFFIGILVGMGTLITFLVNLYLLNGNIRPDSQCVALLSSELRDSCAVFHPPSSRYAC